MHLDEETRLALARLSERSGISQAHIIRRCIEIIQALVEATGRIDFLFDREVTQNLIRECAAISDGIALDAIQQRPTTYPTARQAKAQERATGKQRKTAS